MVEASRERAQRCSSVVTGLCPPGPPGPSGDACADAPYCGGIDPDPVTDAGLGMKGDPFLSSFQGWCSVMWTDGGGLDVDARAAASDGGPHGWLSGGQYVGGGGSLLVVWAAGG